MGFISYFIIIALASSSLAYLWERVLRHEGEIGYYLWLYGSKIPIIGKVLNCVVCFSAWFSISAAVIAGYSADMVVYVCILSMMLSYNFDEKL